MKSESLENWALIAEIVGGVAVVLSLIFVGFQVKLGSEETAQNTRAMEVGAYQELIAQLTELNDSLISNPDFAELWMSYGDCEVTESRTDRRRVGAYASNIIRHADTAYHQFQMGLIDQFRLKQMLGNLGFSLQTHSIVRNTWENYEGLYPEFREYVNSLYSDTMLSVQDCSGNN